MAARGSFYLVANNMRCEMSPYAGSLLLQIMPLIKATVMRSIKPVGCEDHEEIVQDATAMAADMLDSCERKNKALIPKSVAFYAAQAAVGQHTAVVRMPSVTPRRKMAVQC